MGGIADDRNLMQWAETYLQAFQSASVKAGLSSSSGSLQGPTAAPTVSWIPPAHNEFKLNTDAVVRPESGQVGGGFILRNDRGEVLLSACVLLPRCWNVDLAKGLAMLRGIQTTRELGFSSFEVEADSQRLVRMLNEDLRDVSEVGAVADEIRSMLRQGASCRVLFTPRLGNLAAHTLASLAFQYVDSILLEEWPIEASDVICRELLS